MALEGEGIISCLYAGSQGGGEVGDIVLRGIISLFMVEQLGYKLAFSGGTDLVSDTLTD